MALFNFRRDPQPAPAAAALVVRRVGRRGMGDALFSPEQCSAVLTHGVHGAEHVTAVVGAGLHLHAMALESLQVSQVHISRVCQTMQPQRPRLLLGWLLSRIAAGALSA